MTISYVCLNTDEKISSCYKFTLDKRNSESSFSLIKQFEKNCRTDIYGIKENYLFEKKMFYFLVQILMEVSKLIFLRKIVHI